MARLLVFLDVLLICQTTFAPTCTFGARFFEPADRMEDEPWSLDAGGTEAPP